MASDITLFQAALSHLELALANISEQVLHHEVAQGDREAILEAAQVLTALASEEKQHIGVEEKESDKRKRTIVVETKADSVIDAAPLQSPSICASNPEEPASMALPVDSSQVEPVAIGDSSRSLSGPADKMLVIMLDAFDELDTGDHLAVARPKLKDVCAKLGFLSKHTQHVFSEMATTSDNLIYREEWQHIAKTLLALHEEEQITLLVERELKKRREGDACHTGTLSHFKLSDRLRSPHRCIISYKSKERICWDVLMIILLCYITLTLPVSFAFDDIDDLRRIDFIVDLIFVFDLLLTFRTTYRSDLREEIWSQRRIAVHYLKSWFALDFVSSIPWEHIPGISLPRFNSAKVFKFGKLAKVLKTLRLGKMMKIWAGSDLMDHWEEFAWSHGLVLLSRGLRLLIALLVVTHWAACLLLACGGRAADRYLEMDAGEASSIQMYSVALYWAMMTMTTVGYGDVAMVTGVERMYAVVCMIVGGSFYGYIVGSVTTILSEHDMNQRTFTERMEIVVSWLNAHFELPPKMRTRIWRHFKEYLTTKKAIEDSIILNDLPQQLCTEVSTLLLKDSVRGHPIFANLSIGAFSRLVAAISEVKFQADEVIVEAGDLGSAMFILDDGFVHVIERGSITQLCSGDSFGEEVVLTNERSYKYTVRTHSKVAMFRLFRDDLAAQFKQLPEDIATMKKKALHHARQRPHEDGVIVRAVSGRSSIIAGGTSTIMASFPDVVLDRINDVVQRMEHIRYINETGAQVASGAQATIGNVYTRAANLKTRFSAMAARNQESLMSKMKILSSAESDRIAAI